MEWYQSSIGQCDLGVLCCASGFSIAIFLIIYVLLG